MPSKFIMRMAGLGNRRDTIKRLPKYTKQTQIRRYFMPKKVLCESTLLKTSFLYQGAINSYQQAANLFVGKTSVMFNICKKRVSLLALPLWMLNGIEKNAGDNKQQNANQCLLKIANIASAADQLSRAAEIFETIGRDSMNSRLGAYSAKG